MILFIVKYGMRRFKKKANWRDISDVRYGFEQIGRKFDKVNKACRYGSFQIERMKAEWIIPKANPDTDKVMLYFHGGGYAAGGRTRRSPVRSGLRRSRWRHSPS